MPYLSIALSNDLFETARDTLLRECSKTVARILGKDEAYVCVSCIHRPMIFGGDSAPSAFLDLHSIGGLTAEATSALAKKLSEHVADEADVLPERIFVTFTDVPPQLWAWKGATLGKAPAAS